MCSASCASTHETQAFQFLHVITTEVDADFDRDGSLIALVRVEDPAKLAKVLPREALIGTTDSSATVQLTPYPAGDGRELPLHTESTFLIDFDSESVRALRAPMTDGSQPTIEDLVELTQETIEPASDRGFDPASIVAAQKRGDCTEHAVLFGALARSAGYPTRIAIGVVIAEIEGGFQAFGHAWTEVMLDDRWQLVDPTPIEGAEAIAYLPAGYFEEEGPGWALAM
ncbi:MAG: transglutaminase domain-containing protein, partial [Deltaproteobacteria bacterium]|nr:transglutaminase domain-containing protein [Deltaproteobacteria bacterium]